MLVSRRQDDLPQNRHGGWSSLWLVLTVMLFSSWSAHAASISDYQVDLGPPPSSVGAALVTRPQRDAIALQAAACGQEIDFLRLAIKKSNGEDMAKYLVAKVAWLARGADVCRADVSMPLGSSTIINADWHKSFDETFGCASGPIKSIDNLEPLSAIERSEGVVGFHGGLTKKLIKFEVSSRCMKLQVNAALMRMQVDHQPGTDKLPCHLTDVVQGDWDVTVRDLVRIHHLARNASLAPDQKILEDSTQTHLFNDLLTISGGLWPDDYPISGCGDTERATGSPQDRADERSWAEENFAWLGDIWDVVKWFLLALLIILIIALVLALLFYALGATAGFAVAAWVGVLATGATLLGFVALSMLRAPETENHLLMINTSRYLINEMIIEANPTDVHFYVEDQVEVKKWLLERLQRIATTDFDEYNSRPYQRYSIIALLNLHDFVTCDLQRLGSEKDCDLKTATQIVLDLAAAKFVLGSNEGRRSAPFRRLLEVVADDVVDRHRLTDASAGSDYMFGFMLGHAGHTSQLPEHKAERGAINEMIYPATSRYMPAPAVMSVALGEVGAFEQRIHHDGYEIYSRSPSFLVSAGGVRTPSATPGKLGPFDIGERCVDRGAALPTVLIPSGGGYELKDGVVVATAAVHQEDFLRIAGFYYHYDREAKCFSPNNDPQRQAPFVEAAHKDRKLTWSHDANLCVHKGFACGTNILIPPLMEKCLTPPDGSPWRFMSSADCEGMPKTDAFYVVLFQKPCPPGAANCLNTWGFFEAVEAKQTPCPGHGTPCLRQWGDPNAPQPAPDANGAYAAFQAKVRATNPAHETPDSPSGDKPPLAGRYFSPNGHSIEFDAAATMNDSNKAGVGSVNNVPLAAPGDWPLASGDIISASKCPGLITVYGRFEISGKGKGLTIDFCDATKPTWMPH